MVAQHQVVESLHSIMSKGKIICIEGIDKAGKTTQSLMLQDYLMKTRPTRTTLVESFPKYDTRIGNEIWRYLHGIDNYNQFVVNMLYSANRYEMKEELERYIDSGYITILNRYTHSNIAYGAFNGDTATRIEILDQYLPEPDIVIILDIDPLITQKRNVKQDRNERNLQYLQQVRGNYNRVKWENRWNDKYKVIEVDAYRPKEEVHKTIVEIIEGSKILDQ